MLAIDLDFAFGIGGSGPAQEILGKVAEHDIELQLDLARAYAQCSVADASAAGTEAFRANAIYVLNEAVNQGHKDKVYLKTEPDYVPLCDLPEFQALIAKEKVAVAATQKAE